MDTKWFIVPVIAMFMTGACSIPEPESATISKAQPQKVVAFSAESCEPQTKTAFQEDETSIWWSPGDEIAIFYGSSEGSRFTATNAVEVAKAEFQGELEAFTGVTESGAFNYFWAVYPYSSAISCDGQSVVANLSNEQIAKAGSFAPNTNLTIAKSAGLALSFYNVCSWFRFTVNKQGIKRVTFRGNNNEDIAGSFRVSMGNDNRPTAPVLIDGKKEITLSLPGEETLEVGKMYYITLLPQVFARGFTVTFETETESGARIIDGKTTYQRSKYNTGYEFDKNVTYSQDKTVIRANLGESTFDFFWSNKDKIAVWSTDGYYISKDNPIIIENSARFSFDRSIDEGRLYYAVYPSSLIVDNSQFYGQSEGKLDVTLPSTYSYDEVSENRCPCPMIAENRPGTDLFFKHLCAVLKIELTLIPSNIWKIDVDFGSKVCGNFSILGPVLPGSSVISTEESQEDNIITINNITVPESGSININLPVPTGYYNNKPFSRITITMWSRDEQPDGTFSLQKEKSFSRSIGGRYGFSWTAVRSEVKSIQLTPASGIFTTRSLDGDKRIRFAYGNLQAIAKNGRAESPSDWSWHFANEQYECLGRSNLYIIGNGKYSSASYNTVDLFGWSTESTYFGIHNSKFNSTYSGVCRDWGMYLNINGYPAGTWHVMESTSISSIKYDRHDFYRFAVATINGVSGLVLFPDGFYPGQLGLPSISNFNTIGSTDSYTDNTFDLEEWAALEACGCVFLPAAGYRIGYHSNGDLYKPGIIGYYWSRNFPLGNEEVAIICNILTSLYSTELPRYYGCSVRLIYDVE